MKLIDKDKIAAEIEKIQNEFSDSPDRNGNFDDLENQGAHKALDRLEYFLDTLETKEVNLEKELKTLDNTLFDLDGVAIAGTTCYLTVEDVKDIAKRFYELGLNTK